MLTPKTRVVFVEGIPGSGKSTFAQKLSFHLQSCGYTARWHHENDRNHPAIRVGTPAEWDFQNIERRLRDWERFITQATSDGEIVILESALFQKQLNHYVKLRREDELSALFDPLFRILEKASPILIRFEHTGLPSHFRWLAKVRKDALAHFATIARPYASGSPKEMDELSLICAYYTRIQKVSADYTKRFPGQMMVIDQPRKDWRGSFDKICRKLGLPVRIPVRMPKNLASQIAGTYQRTDGLELVIVDNKSGRLFIRHDRDLELMDAEELLFFVDNRPDEIRFELVPNAAPKLRLGGGSMFGSGIYQRKIPDRFTVDRVFVKLT